MSKNAKRKSIRPPTRRPDRVHFSCPSLTKTGDTGCFDPQAAKNFGRPKAAEIKTERFEGLSYPTSLRGR